MVIKLLDKEYIKIIDTIQTRFKMYEMFDDFENMKRMEDLKKEIISIGYKNRLISKELHDKIIN